MFDRRHISRTAVAGLALGIAALGCVFTAPHAEARTFVGLNFGLGVPVYGPGYYYPPPVVYAPPVVYTPAAQPVAAPAPDYSTSYCREYQSTQNIGGTAQPVVGTACRQPDGTWRIVN